MSNLSCPDLQSLDQLVQGELAENQRAELTEHLLHCERCAALVSTIRGSEEITAAIRLKVSQSTGHSAIKQTTDIDTSANSSDSIAEQNAPAEDISFLGPAEADDEIGRLGGYRILQVLGAGGMGVVFKAEDPNLQRLVALKVMKPSIAANPAAKERFLREARSTASIEHHHIVQIYQVGEDRHVPFIAMQFLQGESLQTRLTRENKLPQSEVLRIGREVAAGLAAAHRHGLIHRDIKPDNVWLDTKSGWAKILDFGLVRAATDDAGLTNSGMILGTPRYMAPEQAQGETVDRRSDLFSLGSMLYRLASGEFAFAGNNLVSTLISVVKANPKSIHEVAPELHPELAQSIMKLLAKDPPSRPQTAAEVEAEFQRIEKLLETASQSIEICTLDSIAEHSSPKLATATASRGGGHRHWVIGAGFAALFILAAILFRFKTDDGTVVVELDGTIEIAAVEVDKHKVSFTPDASQKQLTFQVDPGKHSITITTADGLELATSLGEKPLEIKTGDTSKLRAWLEPNPREPTALAAGIKPNSSALAAGMKPNVQRPEPKPAASAVGSLDMAPTVSAVGTGFERPVYDPSPLPKLGTWEPFGTADVDKQYPKKSILGAATLPGLALRPAKLEGIRRWNMEAKLPRSNGGIGKFSPAGKYIAIKNNTGHTWIYEAETLQLKCLIPSIKCVFSSLAWHPDSQSIVIVQENSAIQAWSIDGKLLWDSSSAQTDDNFLNVQFSPDGRTLASIRENDIVLWAHDGSAFEITKVIQSPSPLIGAMSWAPDGASFVVSDSQGTLTIFDRAGETVNQFQGTSSFPHKQILNRLHWSPQGDWIGFIDTIHPHEVQRITPEGKLGSPVNVAQNGSAYYFGWSRDGKQIYASGLNVTTMTNVETGEIRPIPGFVNPEIGWFDVSLDGTKILSCTPDEIRVFDSSLNLTTRRRLEQGGTESTAWNRQGTHFVSAGRDAARLWTSSGNTTVVPGTEGKNASLFAWHPAGNSLAISRLYHQGGLALGNPTEGMREISSQAYERISWSGSGEYVTSKLTDQNKLEIFSDQGAKIKTLDFEGPPAFAFTPDGDLLAVCVGTTLFTCSPDDDWQLHNAFTLNRKTYADMIWSRDGQFLLIKGSSLLRYNQGSFSIVHEGEVLGEHAIDLSVSGEQIVGTYSNRLRLSDTQTGAVTHEKKINTPFIRGVNWHPNRDLFTTCQDDTTIIHWDAEQFEPYWFGVQLPGNQSVAITAAGQILAGDRSVVDEHLVYYIETDEGQIKMLTPTEFETLIGESIFVPEPPARTSSDDEL